MGRMRGFKSIFARRFRKDLAEIGRIQVIIYIQGKLSLMVSEISNI